MSDQVHGMDADRWGGWSWREPRRGDPFRTCSYCGCINPEDLAGLTGWHAQWADRKYGWPHKFYVEGIKPTDPDMLFCIEGGSHVDRMPPSNERMTRIPVADLTPEQRAICVADGMRYSGSDEKGYVGFGKRSTVHAKFYTVHLNDPSLPGDVLDVIAQRSGLRFEFTDDGRVSWGAP